MLESHVDTNISYDEKKFEMTDRRLKALHVPSKNLGRGLTSETLVSIESDELLETFVDMKLACMYKDESSVSD